MRPRSPAWAGYAASASGQLLFGQHGSERRVGVHDLGLEGVQRPHQSRRRLGDREREHAMQPDIDRVGDLNDTCGWFPRDADSVDLREARALEEHLARRPA
jgi:hypothetical protein